MKHTTKRLRLKKDIIARLSHQQLQQIAGGRQPLTDNCNFTDLKNCRPTDDCTRSICICD